MKNNINVEIILKLKKDVIIGNIINILWNLDFTVHNSKILELQGPLCALDISLEEERRTRVLISKLSQTFNNFHSKDGDDKVEQTLQNSISPCDLDSL